MTFRPSTDFKASRNFIRPYEALDKALHRTILKLCSLIIQALKDLENPSWCQPEAPGNPPHLFILQPAIVSECRHMTQTLHRKLSQRCLSYISQISLTYSCHQSFNHLFGQCLVLPTPSSEGNDWLPACGSFCSDRKVFCSKECLVVMMVPLS